MTNSGRVQGGKVPESKAWSLVSILSASGIYEFRNIMLMCTIVIKESQDICSA